MNAASKRAEAMASSDIDPVLESARSCLKPEPIDER